MANPSIHIDAYEYDRLAKLLAGLPAQMQRDIFGRALGRAKTSAVRGYSQLASARMKIKQELIRERMKATAGSGYVQLTIRSSQIPLHKMGATALGINDMTKHASDFGVRVKGRALYEEAFIVKAGAKRMAGLVARRSGNKRLPMKALYGPNPAGEITRNPATYEELLEQIVRTVVADQVLQGVAYAITRASQGATKLRLKD